MQAELFSALLSHSQIVAVSFGSRKNLLILIPRFLNKLVNYSRKFSRELKNQTFMLFESRSSSLFHFIRFYGRTGNLVSDKSVHRLHPSSAYVNWQIFNRNKTEYMGGKTKGKVAIIFFPSFMSLPTSVCFLAGSKHIFL